MSKDAAERLIEVINSAMGTKMTVVGSGYSFKVIDEGGREMLGRGWMVAKELCDRAEAVLYFVQRSGVRPKEGGDEIEKDGDSE